MCTWKELRRWYFTGKYPKTFLGSYFWRKSTKGASEKKTVLLEKMLWYDKRMGPLKTCITQERGEGRLTKEVTKSDVGGEDATKKGDVTHSKKRDFSSDVLFEWLLWYWLILLYFLWVYLLMMLLAFSETNKPYISKWMLIIYTKQDISRTSWSWFAKRVKRWTSKVSEGIL